MKVLTTLKENGYVVENVIEKDDIVSAAISEGDLGFFGIVVRNNHIM